MVFRKNIAKFLAVTTLITAVSAGSHFAYATQKEGDLSIDISSINSAGYAAGKVIVVFKEGYKASAASEELKGLKIKSFENLKKAKKPRKNSNGIEDEKKKETFLLDLQDSSKEELIKVINKLNKEPNVEYAIPDLILEFNSTIPNDEYYSAQYGMDLIGAPEAWEKCKGSKEIVVGVIDTGIDYNHPDLKDNIWTNPGETGFTKDGVNKATDGVDNDGNGYVDDVHGYDFGESTKYIIDSDPMDTGGHGTHCAGIIAAAGNNTRGVTGVSWNTKVAALKVSKKALNNDLAFYSAAIEAINYANAMGFEITSNSWGVEQAFLNLVKLNSEWEELAPLMKTAISKGGLFVGAAGNSESNTDLSPIYPGAFKLDNVITVACTNAQDKLSDNSSYGKNIVDLSAPGSSILSTLPGGIYGYNSGTSMAVPHVAGAAALLLSANSSLTPVQLKGIILSTVDHVEGLKVRSEGRLNVAKAIDKVMGSVLIGDINNDGRVDSTDQKLLSNHINGIKLLTSERQKVAADINGNGLLDEMDNIYMEYYTSGRITALPASKYYAYTYGDVNNDGAVTTADTDLVFKYYLGKDKTLSSKQILAADVNGDNVVNLTDAGLIQQYSNGTLINLPVGN